MSLPKQNPNENRHLDDKRSQVSNVRSICKPETSTDVIHDVKKRIVMIGAF